MSRARIHDTASTDQYPTLRTSGFESTIVRAPSWEQDDELAHFYTRAARADATAFANELAARCVEPRRHPDEVGALPDSDRSRRRVALVAAVGT